MSWPSNDALNSDKMQFFRPLPIFTSAVILRAVLLLYGLYQDANSPLKYTDIDYYVFTDASRFVAHGASPYDRATYRYPPLLAWLLLPTTWSPQWLWFSFGKVIFALGDIVAGWFMYLILRDGGGKGAGMGQKGALKFASIWLLNPMVATISTRGSSEGLLGVMVVGLLWAVLGRKIVLAGVLLGVGVHFKIYPFIYAPAIVWWMDEENLAKPVDSSQSRSKGEENGVLASITRFLNKERITLAIVSLSTFMGLNAMMYLMYGFPFLQHTFLHHVTRLDHRHNFSPYNTLLYLRSSRPESSTTFAPESLAFLPQLFLSAIALPLLLAKRDLPSTMLAQTFAFVTFNKVCTSQYFIWYLALLPFHLSYSSLLKRPYVGISALVLWVASQGLWLQQGFELEFNGKTTFVPGLWGAGLGFFAVNCWLLGIFVRDIGNLDGIKNARLDGNKTR